MMSYRRGSLQARFRRRRIVVRAGHFIALDHVGRRRGLPVVIDRPSRMHRRRAVRDRIRRRGRTVLVEVVVVWVPLVIQQLHLEAEMVEMV